MALARFTSTFIRFTSKATSPLLGSAQCSTSVVLHSARAHVAESLRVPHVRETPAVAFGSRCFASSVLQAGRIGPRGGTLSTAAKHAQQVQTSRSGIQDRMRAASRVFSNVRFKSAASASTSPTAVPGSSGHGLIQIAKRHPFTVGVVIACVKTGVCDYLVQVYLQGKEHNEVDWRRICVFLGFGGIYLGAGQWFVYVTLFRRMFPGMNKFAEQSVRDKLRNKEGLRALAGQVLFDNFVHYPFVYFPVFYVFKASLQVGGADEVGDRRGPWEVAKDALTTYSQNAWEDNLAMWAMWIPVDVLVYSAPIWLRLPLNHGISFVWTCILSAMRGSETVKTVQTADPEASPSAAA
eukprot:1195911-Prorocentrum_minimum.AAC.3